MISLTSIKGLCWNFCHTSFLYFQSNSKSIQNARHMEENMCLPCVKKGDVDNIGNYRPVSLCDFSKIWNSNSSAVMWNSNTKLDYIKMVLCAEDQAQLIWRALVNMKPKFWTVEDRWISYTQIDHYITSLMMSLFQSYLQGRQLSVKYRKYVF